MRSRLSELFFPLAAIVPAAILTTLLFGHSGFVETLLFGAVSGALSSVLFYAGWGRNAVMATEEGIVARIRGRDELAYRWDQVANLTWEAGTWGFIGNIPFGSRVLVHPVGGPYDMPGPHQPLRVGAVQPPLPWRRRAVAVSVTAHLEELLRQRTGR